MKFGVGRCGVRPRRGGRCVFCAAMICRFEYINPLAVLTMAGISSGAARNSSAGGDFPRMDKSIFIVTVQLEKWVVNGVESAAFSAVWKPHFLEMICQVKSI